MTDDQRLTSASAWQEPRNLVSDFASGVSSLAEDAWNQLDFRRWLVIFGLGVRQGMRRARGSIGPLLAAGLAAGFSFAFASYVLGHPSPFLAPTAAWICLGFTYNRVPRKVLEIGAGVAIGIGIGELVLIAAGAGAWQLGLGLFLAGLVARIMDRGDLFSIQAGVNAIVVVGMGTVATQAPGSGPTRMLDALIGAVIAFCIAVFVPTNVLDRPTRYVANLLAELAATFTMVGEGVQTGNKERLRDAHAQLRGVQRILDETSTVWRSSADIVKLSPTMRRHREEIAELGRQLEISTRAVHTVELLLRQSRGVVDERGAMPDVAELIDDSAVALNTLSASVRKWQPPRRARAMAVAIAAACAPQHARLTDWRRVVLVSVMRSVAMDLMQLTGLSRTEAERELPGEKLSDSARDGALSGDEGSALWGDELHR